MSQTNQTSLQPAEPVPPEVEAGAVEIVPHTFGIAVWDVPSSASAASSFHVKVGVQCSAGCQLAGSSVEVRDETGATVAEGRLGDTPLTGTNALHWSTIELQAPAVEGLSSRSVVFVPASTDPPHEGAAVTFTFWTAPAPEHSVTVKIVDQATRAPVSDVEVRFGRYTSSTDESGVATLALPTGIFEVSIRKDGFQAEPLTVEVDDSLAVEIEAVKVLTRAEMDEKMFDEHPWG